MAFSPDWSLLAVGFSEYVDFWQVATGRPLERVKDHVRNTAAGIVFSPDGASLAGISGNGTVDLWPVLKGYSGDVLARARGVRAAAFSPDGTLLITGSADGTVQIWETESRWCLHTLHGHTGAVNSVAFSADGTYFVSGGWDGTVRVWGVPRQEGR